MAAATAPIAEHSPGAAEWAAATAAVWLVPEQDLQFRADWQIMVVSRMFATAE